MTLSQYMVLSQYLNLFAKKVLSKYNRFNDFFLVIRMTENVNTIKQYTHNFFFFFTFCTD